MIPFTNSHVVFQYETFFWELGIVDLGYEFRGIRASKFYTPAFF